MSLPGGRGRTQAPRGTVRVGALVGLLVLGIWLSIAPFTLGYREAGVPLRATVNDSAVGVAIVGLALIGLSGADPRR